MSRPNSPQEWPAASGQGGIVVLSGGVGGARFLLGLTRAFPDAPVTVIGNTGDDFKVHGLHVCPDLDTVVYTLAGMSDPERGWGLRHESWRTLGQLGRLGEPTWFQLGDLDLATHIWRSDRLQRGVPLSRLTADLAARLGAGVSLLPMTDQQVTTMVTTRDGRELHIQEYLVAEQCAPEIADISFRGIGRARPAPGVLAAIREAALVVIAPSNPIISIGPILAIPGVRQALQQAGLVAAISPIIAGRAVKGPAAQMLAQRGVEATALGVARLYSDLAQLLVIDRQDGELAQAVKGLGVRPVLADTLMVDQSSRERLARQLVEAVGFQTVPVP